MNEQKLPPFWANSLKRRGAQLLLLGVLALVAAIAVWLRLRDKPSVLKPETRGQNAGSVPAGLPGDPRLTFASPYRNIRPDVKYLGDQSCARCHAQIVRSYHHHPMGRSLVTVSGVPSSEPSDMTQNADFQAQGFHYRVERRGDVVVHRETKEDRQGRVLAEIEAEVQFAVGSGTRGRSYLINREGYLFQSPITWYPQKQTWDLSPGYARRHHHFSRPVPAECLFCHSNHAQEVEGTVNRYQPPIFGGYAIGCERCHGPGELHVRRHERGEELGAADTTIINPGRLDRALREAVCEQCHLQGDVRVLRRGRGIFDYRPGLPLDQFVSVFVSSAPLTLPSPPARGEGRSSAPLTLPSPPPRGEGRASAPTPASPAAGGEGRVRGKFVGHVEQMHASRCFNGSAGKLGCTSCHDPHQLPAAAERVAYYRDRCLICHRENGCSLPARERLQKNMQDSCIACHMPAGKSDILHASVTDHRIIRDTKQAPASERTPKPLPPNEVPLVYWQRGAGRPDDSEVARDLGIALMDRVERYPEPIRRALAERALPLLQRALQTDEEDVPAWQAKARALWRSGQTAEAAAAFETILSKSPLHEATLHDAATLAMERERPDAARRYWDRAIGVNPWRYEFHDGLAAAHAQLRDWPGAIEECRRALRLNPFNWQVRKLLVRCYLASGTKDRARTEFERLLALEPPDPEGLRRWYAAQNN